MEGGGNGLIGRHILAYTKHPTLTHLSILTPNFEKELAIKIIEKGSNV